MVARGPRYYAHQRGDKTYISEKACPRCGSYEKTVACYSCVPCRKRDGLKKLNNEALMAPYRTKEKQREKTQKWRKVNKEKMEAYHEKYKPKKAAYYQANKDRFRDKHLSNTYGINADEYNRLLVEQNSKCAICGIDKCATGKAFAVDHDHQTNKVRGLLCMKCNRGIGLLGSEENLVSAIKYLKRFTCESL